MPRADAGLRDFLRAVAKSPDAGAHRVAQTAGMRYRRFLCPNASVFLTLVTRQREPLLAEPAVRAALSRAFAVVRTRHATALRAYVVLPDHCHLIWELPEDGDFSLRVRLLKHAMARRLADRPSVWQARFWDHHIRGPGDLERHLDYIHFNPVKHGWVAQAADWDDSSFKWFVERGGYAPERGVATSIDRKGRGE